MQNVKKNIVSPSGIPAAPVKGIKNKRIMRRRDVWDLVISGRLLRFLFDTETTGLPKNGGAYPKITEFAGVITDVNGNIFRLVQEFPRIPDHVMFDPASPIVTRQGSVKDYYAEWRTPYQQAIANIVWQFLEASTIYNTMSDQSRIVEYYNAQNGHIVQLEEKKKASFVVDIPLLDDDGNITYDVRWHIKEQKFAYRFTKEAGFLSTSQGKVGWYQDKSDGSLWKFVSPKIDFVAHNKRFDMRVLQQAFRDIGMSSSDVSLLTSQSSVSGARLEKSFTVDTRDILRAVSLLGEGGDKLTKLARKLDLKSGRLFPTESLGPALDTFSDFGSILRNMPKGIVLHNGALPLEATRHGALEDTLQMAALLNWLIDVSPDIAFEVIKQADYKKYFQDMMQGDMISGDRNKLFTRPKKEFPEKTRPATYLYLGSDAQVGNFNRIIWVEMGGLRNEKYAGIPLSDLSIEQLVTYIEKRSSSIQLENYKFRQPAFPDIEMRMSKAGSEYEYSHDDIMQDLYWIGSNPDFVNKIINAIGIVNKKRSENNYTKNPSTSTEVGIQDLGKVPFYFEDISNSIAKTINQRQQEAFDKLSKVNKVLSDLISLTHRNDSLMEFDFGNIECEENKDALKVLNNFNNLYKKSLKTLLDKGKNSYARLIKSYYEEAVAKFDNKGNDIIKAKRKNNIFRTLEAANYFRWELRKRAMQDHLDAICDADSDFQKGYASVRDFISSEEIEETIDIEKVKLLFPIPSAGRNNDAVQVVDSESRIISYEEIKRMRTKDVKEKLDSSEWSFRFHRLRSDATIMNILTSFDEHNRLDEIDSRWSTLLKAQKQLSVHGHPNEADGEKTHACLSTMKEDLQKLEANESLPLLYPEAKALIAEMKRFIAEQEKKYRVSNKLTKTGGFDPRTGGALQRYLHEVDKNRCVTIKAPARVLRSYIKNNTDPRLPASFVILEKPDKETLRKIIEEEYDVKFVEEETGRQLFGGKVTLYNAPSIKDSKYKFFTTATEKAYRDSKKTFPKNPVIFAVEGMYPIANTRKLDTKMPTILLTEQDFWSLTAPQLVNLPDKKALKTIVVPAFNIRQKLSVGEQVALRKAKGEQKDFMCGVLDPTGEEGEYYTAEVKTVTKLSLTEFNDKARKGELDELLEGSNIENVARYFDDLVKENQVPHDEIEVLIVQFNKRVRKDRWGYLPIGVPPQVVQNNKKQREPVTPNRVIYGGAKP